MAYNKRVRAINKALGEAREGWTVSAKAYLDRLGFAEYIAQLSQHTKTRARSTFRYCPTDYHKDLIDCLDANDEVRFKQIKQQRGYTSELDH